MTKSSNTTLSAQIHDEILELIIGSGENSDKMLLTERELMERFGVSKAPVREALLRLCAEEVLTSIPRCGYVVVRLGEKSGRDNLVVRQMLEISSLERYFDAFTSEKLDAIEATLHKAREECMHDNSIWTIWRYNLIFHCDLVSVSDNPYLVKHLEKCIETERRFYAQNHWSKLCRSKIDYYPEAHEKILNAIREGDKALALKLLSEDIADVTDIYD